MENIEGRFLQFQDLLEIAALSSLIFVALALVETIWDFARKKRPGYSETAANVAILFVNQALELTLYGSLFVIALYGFELLQPFQIPLTWWSMILAIVVADFTYYWMHRIEHEVRILWSFHSVHHSSPEFNFTTAMRLAWIEGLVEWMFFIPMVLIGFDLVQTTVAVIIVVVYQNWIHTQKIGKLGWLDKVFNTPSVHRVHHGKNPQYIDKNYGGILIIWDRLFGTYEAEVEAVEFGITDPPNSANPIKINFFELWQTLKDAAGARSLRNKLGYLFKQPGWKPDGK